MSCSRAICHKRGRICTFLEKRTFLDEERLHPGHPLQSATSASMMIAVDREERLARRQGHEHTPGELWSAATPTSWSSKHRLPRILMDPRLRDGSTPSTTPPPLEIAPTNIQSRLRAAPRSIIIPRQIR